MKWIDKWFFRKWQWAWENRDQPDIGAKLGRGLAIVEEDSIWSDGLRINIKKNDRRLCYKFPVL